MERDVPGQQMALTQHEIEFDLPGRRVLSGGREIHLTPIEFRMLLRLATNSGQVFSREELVASLHDGRTIVLPRTVDVHVKAIRKKLGVNCIATVRGKGYCFIATSATCRSDEAESASVVAEA